MSNKNTKMINRIKKAIAPLTPVLLKDIPRPQTVEEGRANLRRFYGCINGRLEVRLHRKDLNNNEVQFPNGERVKDSWHYYFPEDKVYPEPHEAIVEVMKIGGYVYLSIDPDKVDNLEDLYKITKSGCFNKAHDPSFTMNLIMGGNKPIVEGTPHTISDTFRFMKEVQERLGDKYFADAWLKDPTGYRLYPNDDPALQNSGGFFYYSVEMALGERWRQINNRETRYLHWLLLGPFAPYQFGTASEELAA